MVKMIDGEVVTDNELADLRRMIEHDCREFAGVWFEMPQRSKKCRATWADVGKQLGQSPVEVFVNLKWVQFIDMVKQWYGTRIPKEPEDIQKRLHQACVVMNLLGEMPEARDVLQMEMDTKAFFGDKFENRHISETYGDGAASLDSILRGSHTVN